MNAEPEWETLSFRVPREMADQIKAIATREDRPLSAELRRLVRRRIDEKTPNGDETPIAA